MSVDALVDAMPVAVGRRVREARKRRGWTLDQLAERSSVSRRMIVNVEAGSTNASIATLLRLATALGVTLADLVADGDAGAPVALSRDREALWRGHGGGSATLVTSAATPDMLELWDWTLEPGEQYASEAHPTGTWELLHVRSGHLHVELDGDVHDLRAGDGLSFAADVPHAYKNQTRRSVRFTMTVLEPLTRVRP